MGLKEKIGKYFSPNAPTVATPGKMYSGTSSLRSYVPMDSSVYFANYTFACVDRKASAFAMTNHFWADKEGDKKETKLDYLLTQPNPMQNGMEFKYLISMWLDFLGNAYIWFDGKDLIILPTNKVEVVPLDVKPYVKQYIFDNGTAQKLVFTPDQIIHLKQLKPSDDFQHSTYMGQGIYSFAGKAATNADTETIGMQYDVMKANAIAPFILTTKDEVSIEAWAAFKEEWKKNFPNAPLGGVLEKEGKVEQLTSGEHMAALFKDGADVSIIKRLAAIYKIPLGMLDTSSQQNKATADTNNYVFRNDVVEWQLRHFEMSLTNFFGKQVSGLTLTHEPFTYIDPAQDVAEKNLLIQAYTAGIVSNNEVRERLGLPEIVEAYKTEPVIPEIPLDNTEPKKPIETPEEPKDEEPKSILDIHRKQFNGIYYEDCREEVLKNYSDRYNNLNHKFQDRLSRQLVYTFRKIQKDVIRNLDKYAKTYSIKSDPFDIGDYQDEISDSVNPVLKTYITGVINTALKDIGENYNETDFLKKVRSIIDSSTSKITDSFDTLGRNVKDILKGIADNNPTANAEDLRLLMREAINNQFDEIFTVSRINTISQTTATASLSSAQKEAWREFDRNYVWLCQRTGKSRATHVDADGQTPDADGMFTVGSDYMDAPGNGSLAEENCNCMCCLMPTRVGE